MYKDRPVYLRAQLDKFLKLLDKIKSLGDAAASIDPIHAGLPWAGFKLILEVRTWN